MAIIESPSLLHLVKEFYDSYNIKERYNISFQHMQHIAMMPFRLLLYGMRGFPFSVKINHIGTFKVSVRRLIYFYNITQSYYKRGVITEEKFEEHMRFILSIMDKLIQSGQIREKNKRKLIYLVDRYKHLLY